MAGPGLYYPSPPVFVGGRQPYAPAQPVPVVTVATSSATPYLQLRFAQLQAVTSWQPGPITIVWSGPSGATVAAPDPPVPLPAMPLGRVHLYTVLRAWEPVLLPLRVYLPHLPTPAGPLAQTAPYFNTGQLHLVRVLQAWEPVVRVMVIQQRAIPNPLPAGTGGGRLIGPNRLLRA